MNNHPVCSHRTRTDVFVDDDDMDSKTVAESEMSLNPDHSCTG